jgi:hypothetical protein
MTLDLVLDGEPLRAQAELRYLSAPDGWVFSVRDGADGELLVNQIPLRASGEELLDLLRPFRHLRGGKGLGALYCLRGADDPDGGDPGRDTLTDFRLFWADIGEET